MTSGRTLSCNYWNFEIIKTFGNAMALRVICLQNMGLVFVSLHNMLNTKENLIFPPQPPLWLLLCLVKFWGCWHLLWGLVKAIRCPSDVTMPWKIQSMLVWHQFWLKKTQSILQKTITRTKKSGTRWWEWQKSCSNVGVPPCKLKTLVKTKFASSMSLPFYYGRKSSLMFQGRASSSQVWAIT